MNNVIDPSQNLNGHMYDLQFDLTANGKLFNHIWDDAFKHRNGVLT